MEGCIPWEAVSREGSLASSSAIPGEGTGGKCYSVVIAPRYLLFR